MYQKLFGSKLEVECFENIKDLAVGSLMKKNSSSSCMSRIILVRGVFKLSLLSDWLIYRERSLARSINFKTLQREKFSKIKLENGLYIMGHNIKGKFHYVSIKISNHWEM